MDKSTPSAAQLKAIRAAAARERGNICPIIGVHAAAETALVTALDRRGWVSWDGPAPRVSDAARQALAEEIA